jgi:S-adenosylmethionine:tRNA ribosyltransferase-isomerase
LQNDFEMEELQKIRNDYSFELPDRLIARYPSEFRDESRLLHLPSGTSMEESGNRQFRELPELLKEDDILVWNDTMVEPRRVYLQRETGARIEALFLEPQPSDQDSAAAWTCLIRNAAKLRSGETLIEPNGGKRFRFSRVTEEHGDQFALHPLDETDMAGFFRKYGRMPIPPYLGRGEEELDRVRYQTVYATSSELSSAAAPTAGLHFTDSLIKDLQHRGIRIVSLQLAVGIGTFSPLSEEHLQTGTLHAESFFMPDDTADILNETDGRIIAVGTTTLRALESNMRQYQRFEPGQFRTNAFFRPPDRIQSIHGLITNFHLPASSLLLLVCAFGGTDRILAAYRAAIELDYRFYSYGDAMLVFA